jgi:hypothetical protein
MAWRSENGEMLGIGRLTVDDFFDFLSPQKNQISYQTGGDHDESNDLSAAVRHTLGGGCVDGIAAGA